MRLFGFVLVAVTGLSLARADADTCDNYKTPTQVLAGLSSEDPVAKLGAKTCGLNSDDASLRGVLLQQLLVGLSGMSFDLAAQPKDTEGEKLVDRFPSLVVSKIQWDKDGRVFSGDRIPKHVGRVQGQFFGSEPRYRIH